MASLMLGVAAVFLPAGPASASRPATGTSTMTKAAAPAPTTRKSLVVKSPPLVETSEIVVTMKLMDLARGQKPKEYHGEAGSCESKFSSNYGFETMPAEIREVEGEFVATLRVQAPSAKVKVAIDLWIPARASAWLIDHEETHRAITERVYQEGVLELNAYLKTVNGRAFEGRGKTKTAASQAARQAVLNEYNETYIRMLPGRQKLLNEEFDRLSEHGMNHAKSAGQWMKEIFAAEKKAKEKAAEAGATSSRPASPAGL